MNTELVQLHSCLKNNGRVVIKSTIVKGKHGDIVSLTAHDEKCKVA
jgi:hypothetical protein